MRSLVLHPGRSGWSWDARPTPALRLILLLGLSRGAQRIRLTRDGDQTELGLRHADHAEQLIPPPAHLVDELAEEIRRFACWRDRITDWWDRHRRCTVLAEREGTVRLCLGGGGAEMSYWVLPYSGGVLVELTLCPEPGITARAEAILLARQEA